MLSNTQVTKILTLGIKKRSALNLYNQSSRKWKRSDSMSSPFRNKNIHTDFSWSALQTARLRQVESRYNWSRLKSWWQTLTLRLHFNCIYRFHRLCVRHVAEHAHGTLLKGFLQRVSPRVNSWKRKKKGFFLLKTKKKTEEHGFTIPKRYSLYICCVIQVWNDFKKKKKEAISWVDWIKVLRKSCQWQQSWNVSIWAFILKNLINFFFF